MGMHRWLVNSPRKGPVARKKLPFDDVIKLFDEAQITADNEGHPIRQKHWQYIHNMDKNLKHTMACMKYGIDCMF